MLFYIMASNLESNRTLGGVGAILLTIGSIFPPLALVGVILLLIALKGLSEYYNDKDIYRDSLYGVIFGIVGIAVATIIFAIFFIRMRAGRLINPPISPYMLPIRFIFGIIVVLAAIFIFFLLEAIFLRKSFDHLSVKTGNKMFETAGLLLLIGAILTIVLVGFIILFAAWIVTAVSLFSIQSTQQVMPAPSPQPVT